MPTGFYFERGMDMENLKRGEFISTTTWKNIMERRPPVYVDGMGEYAVVEGGKVRPNDPALGMTGVVLEVSHDGGYLVHLRNGMEVWLHPALVQAVRTSGQRRSKKKEKPLNPRGKKFKRYKELMQAHVIRS